MTKVYFPPAMMVVELQQESHILAGSLNNVDNNVGLDYVGGGNGDAMSPELEEFFGF